MSDQIQKTLDDHCKDPAEARKRDTPEQKGHFISYVPTKKIKMDDFDYLEKHMRQRFKKNEISLLAKELEIYKISRADIARFFEQKSYDIFHWILVESPNSTSFEFILDKFSHEAIKYNLRANNFSVLIEHLEGRAAVEKYGLLTQQDREADCDRFKFLLKVDPDGIQEFMAKNKTATFMKPSTWEDYEIALQSYNATKRHGTIPPTP